MSYWEVYQKSTFSDIFVINEFMKEVAPKLEGPIFCSLPDLCFAFQTPVEPPHTITCPDTL